MILELIFIYYGLPWQFLAVVYNFVIAVLGSPLYLTIYIVLSMVPTLLTFKKLRHYKDVEYK